MDAGLQLAVNENVPFDRQASLATLRRLQRPDQRYSTSFKGKGSWSATAIAYQDLRLLRSRAVPKSVIRRANAIVDGVSQDQSKGRLLNTALPAMELLAREGRNVPTKSIAVIHALGSGTDGASIRLPLTTELLETGLIRPTDSLVVNSCAEFASQGASAADLDAQAAFSFTLFRCDPAGPPPAPPYSRAGFSREFPIDEQIENSLYGALSANWSGALDEYRAGLSAQAAEWNEQAPTLVGRHYLGVSSLIELDRLLGIASPELPDLQSDLAKAVSAPADEGNLQVLVTSAAMGLRTDIPETAASLVATSFPRSVQAFVLELLANVDSDEGDASQLQSSARQLAQALGPTKAARKTPEVLALLNWVERTKGGEAALASLCSANRAGDLRCSLATAGTDQSPVEAYVISQYPYDAQSPFPPIAF